MTRSPPRPEVRPANPCFSSGPCAKRPGWSVAALGAAALGRSHRSAAAKAKIAAVIERSRGLLVWVDFLAQYPASRSCTSVCLSIADAWFGDLAAGEQRGLVKIMSDRLAEEGVAYDVNGYRDAPPGLRVWAGATVERSDIEALLPWLDWAYALAKAQHGPC